MRAVVFLPLLHQRIKSAETPAQKTAEQLKQVCQELEPQSLALYDSEYGSRAFLNLTADIPCDLFFRLRPNRKLRLRQPQTWGPADEEWEFVDPKLGRVRIQRWNDLHFEETPKRLLTLFRIERLESRGTRRDPRVVWLGYCGADKARQPKRDMRSRRFTAGSPKALTRPI